MKSKEEIEQLANEYTGGMYLNPTSYYAFIDGYTKCQEDMADEIKKAYKQGLEEYANYRISLLSSKDVSDEAIKKMVDEGFPFMDDVPKEDTAWSRLCYTQGLREMRSIYSAKLAEKENWIQKLSQEILKIK